ncbi:MAG: hypothetical protein WBF38_03870, partial [Nitrosotalea sp.]
MSHNFEAQYIEEPELVFGGQGEDKDPRIGLKRYGPYFYSDEDAPLESVRLGIIGNRECIQLVEKIIKLIQQPVSSPKPNKWLYPDYPGMTTSTPFKCNIKTSSNWNAVLSDDYDIKKIENILDANQRIAYGVQLYVDKVKEISGNDDFPDVIICVLPKTVEEYCGISERTRGAKRVKISPLEAEIAELKEKRQSFLTDWGFEVIEKRKEPEKSYDFRNSLKGKVMEFGIPTQILRQS